MTIVVIADVGVLDDMIHIGDEAMFEQAVTQLRDRGAGSIVGLSANPGDTSARYGIDALPRIGFAGDGDRMRARMRAVVSDELPADDPGLAVARAIRSSTGVVIAGGGNLASTWPTHIYERATIGRLAKAAGVPLVVTGQTLGPHLTPEHGELVSELIASAALVGVRDDASLGLARTWGPTGLVARNPDDAAFLAGVPGRPAGSPDADYALVTVMPHTGQYADDAVVATFATLLDRVAADRAIVFSPHWGSLREGDVRGDSVMHSRIRARMAQSSIELPPRSSRESATLARRASIVISTRYHPAVFAAAAGVPVIGVPVDEYTGVKLDGALGTFGQRPTPFAALDRLDPASLERVRIASSFRENTRAWWDAVASAVG